jgi:hypothetical protein
VTLQKENNHISLCRIILGNRPYKMGLVWVVEVISEFTHLRRTGVAHRTSAGHTSQFLGFPETTKNFYKLFL